MKVKFQQNDQLSNNEVYVTVEANHLTDEARELVTSINKMQKSNGIISIAINDRIIVLKAEQVVAVEVLSNQLTIYTLDNNYESRGTLTHFLDELANSDMVQVAKGIAVNINEIDYLENEFSGNMIAVMINKLKFHVSRKYLPFLKKKLGL